MNPYTLPHHCGPIETSLSPREQAYAPFPFSLLIQDRPVYLQVSLLLIFDPESSPFPCIRAEIALSPSYCSHSSYHAPLSIAQVAG